MDANFDVAVSLMKYEAKLNTKLADNIMETINRVLKADERDVNVWMNKAMFKTLKAPSNLVSAMEALTRAKELLVEVDQLNDARVQYGLKIRLTCKVKFDGNSIDLMKAEDDNNESMLALQQ